MYRGVLEKSSLRRQAVQNRRGNVGASVAAESIGPQGIDGYQDEIPGNGRRYGGGRATNQQRENKAGTKKSPVQQRTKLASARGGIKK